LRRQYGVLFHSAMPTNLYGPGDNYHPKDSHVLPALIRRFHEARESGAEAVTIWGTGTPRREFLHVDDLAEGLLYLLELENPPDWVNIGSGEDIPIRELAGLIAEVIGFEGEIRTDPDKPDGTPRKLMDTTLIRELGWKPRISLKAGIASAYQDFLAALESGRLRS
jgi:GDP-L-fucose synthase